MLKMIGEKAMINRNILLLLVFALMKAVELNAMTSLVLKGHSSSVTAVAISNDNSFVVTGSYDRTACIWNAKDGALKHKLIGHTKEIKNIAISKDNSFIVTGSG